MPYEWWDWEEWNGVYGAMVDREGRGFENATAGAESRLPPVLMPSKKY